MKVVSMVRTCEACPSQWNGVTDDNRQVYFRYRWGDLSVRVAAAGDTDEYAAVCGEEVVSLALGDDMDGYLSYEDLVSACRPYIELPEATP